MSAAEQAIDNMTKAQAMPRIAPSGTETCPEGRIRIGVFFDGTNNSMYRDRATDPHNPGSAGNALTNVVKLYDVYQHDDALLKRIYHHGVGTDSSSQGHGSKEHAADWRGQGFGAGGKARVTWGLQQLADFFSQNNNHLAKEKLFDTYGFSRGAAIARDFVNSVRTVGIDNLKKQNGFKYITVPNPAGAATPGGPSVTVIRVPAYERHTGILPTFLGVFDTVASFGLGGLQAGNALAGYNLFVDHSWVRRTVHMAAEDEIRGNFPLSSLFMDPNDKSSWLPWRRNKYQDPQQFKGTMVEIWYPGAHSDVGGGYVLEPGEPGRPERRTTFVDEFGVEQVIVIPAKPPVPPRKPDLAIIPLRDMHRASVRAEVPLSALPSTQGPGDMEGWYAEYDAYRSGQPYAIGKQYIQTFPPVPYLMMYYRERDKKECIIHLKTHYIHDSRWTFPDKVLGRSQRTVLYMGPQPVQGG